jgi:hypothetical protein
VDHHGRAGQDAQLNEQEAEAAVDQPDREIGQVLRSTASSSSASGSTA